MPKKKVLFVDDSPMDRMILSQVLEELGLEAIDTKNPADFLGALKSEEPDICLIDLNIKQPNDGQVLVRAIRNIIGKHLPIILISATEKSELIKESLCVGANDFICKPIDKSLLSSKLSNYLNTQKIKSSILPLFKVPDVENRKCIIQFKTFIERIDESGIQFVSNHAVKENAKFFIEDDFIKRMFKIDEGIEMFVQKSWNGSAENVYHFYASFGTLDNSKKQKLRKFITDLQIQQHASGS